MYIRCSCSCPLLLTIFGTLPLRHKSYKYHEKLIFVPSAFHLPLVNLTSEMSYEAYASCCNDGILYGWPISHNGHAKNLQRLTTTICNDTMRCFSWACELAIEWFLTDVSVKLSMINWIS